MNDPIRPTIIKIPHQSSLMDPYWTLRKRDSLQMIESIGVPKHSDLEPDCLRA